MPYDDTGYLKEAYYGGGSGTSVPEPSSSSGGNFLQNVSGVLGAVNPILGVASSVLGGILGNKAQSDANRANIMLQRETNALNYRMFNESNQFSEYMWNKQNEYNTPAAQAERLKAAGINPAFVFGNGSVSEAGGVSSASPPTMQSPHVDPYNPLPAAQTAIDAFMQSQMNNAQIGVARENQRHLSIQNDLDFIQAIDKIESMRIDNKQKNQFLDWYIKTRGVEDDILHANLRNVNAATDNYVAQANAATIHSAVESALAESQIHLNNAQIWQIGQYINQHWVEIQQNAEHLANERRGLDIQESSVNANNAYLGNAIIHMMNQDANEFERIGIDKELLESRKFSQVMTGVAAGVVGSLIPVGKFLKGMKGATKVMGFMR